MSEEGRVIEPPGSLRRPTFSAYPCGKLWEVADASSPAVGRPEGEQFSVAAEGEWEA